VARAPLDACLREEPADAAALRRRVDREHPHARLVRPVELGQRPWAGDVRDRAEDPTLPVCGDEHPRALDPTGHVAQLGLVAVARREARDRRVGRHGDIADRLVLLRLDRPHHNVPRHRGTLH
jgi:hypothetical protein